MSKTPVQDAGQQLQSFTEITMPLIPGLGVHEHGWVERDGMVLVRIEGSPALFEAYYRVVFKITDIDETQVAVVDDVS